MRFNQERTADATSIDETGPLGPGGENASLSPGCNMRSSGQVSAIPYFLASGHAWFASGLYFLLLRMLDAARVLDGHPVVRRVAQVVLVLSLPFAALPA